MNAPHDENPEEKIHPFLFIILIFSVGFILINSWNAWEEKVSTQSLQDVIRSEDIEILLDGGAFSRESDISEFSGQLRTETKKFLSKQVLAKEKSEESSKDKIASKNFSEDRNTNPSNTEGIIPDYSASDIPDYSEDIVNLALRDVFVYQGADGVENWRLKAEWATLRKTTSVLNLSQPTLLYRTGDKKNTPNTVNATNTNSDENSAQMEPFKIPNSGKNRVQRNYLSVSSADNSAVSTNTAQTDFFINSEEMLLITAKNGLIFDNNTKIHLTDDVLAKQKNNYVQSSILDYNDSTRIATFPNFANFSGENIKGNALTLTWDLNTNQLTGTNGIEMTWYPSQN